MIGVVLYGIYIYYCHALYTYPEIKVSVVVITSQDVAIGKVTYTRVSICIQYKAWVTPKNLQTNITGSALQTTQKRIEWRGGKVREKQ